MTAIVLCSDKTQCLHCSGQIWALGLHIMRSKIVVNHSALQTTTTKIFPLKQLILVWTVSLERFTLIISSSPAVLFLATMSPLSLYEMKTTVCSKQGHFTLQKTRNNKSYSHFLYKIKYFHCDWWIDLIDRFTHILKHWFPLLSGADGIWSTNHNTVWVYT